MVAHAIEIASALVTFSVIIYAFLPDDAKAVVNNWLKRKAHETESK
jgi:hypothetical protein